MTRHGLPLITLTPAIGKKNYFDCRELAFGGVVNYSLRNPHFIKRVYGSIDALCAAENGLAELALLARPFDVSHLLIESLDFKELRFDSLHQAMAERKADEPFVVEFDEFYFSDYSHYQKSHFLHSSFVARSLDEATLEIHDPVLDFRVESIDGAYEKKRLSLPIPNDSEHSPYSIVLLRGHGRSVNNAEANRFLTALARKNLEQWSCESPILIEGQNLWMGVAAMRALLHHMERPLNLSGIGSELYKWIFPLAWKSEMLCLENSPLSYAISDHLHHIIDEMEILETLLLRVGASYNQKLHDSAVQRWRSTIEMIEMYLEMEARRISERRDP